ncbi:MAG: type II toxin-antitoxin system VapC family toxin [Alphaproteobacteria bacterium]|nr:type II toxin-antitoxin system VapC family toxin [Alphaproteobacteria bacterium]MDE2110519.1 type II toxin-antitoxin system VapC family toxin [Alphaproteobacteria bacterium]
MQGLDTNVLVRFLLKDDARQARLAKAEIDRANAAGETLLVSLLTVLETEWVLRTRAGLEKADIIRTFKQLLEARDLAFDDEAALEGGLHAYENSKADFAECLMMAHYLGLGCSTMLTFDAAAAKVPGCKLLTA